MRLAVTVPEAAEMIGCSTSMVRKLIAQGDISKAKVGRRTVIRVAELERFLTDSETANAPAMQAEAAQMVNFHAESRTGHEQ